LILFKVLHHHRIFVGIVALQLLEVLSLFLLLEGLHVRLQPQLAGQQLLLFLRVDALRREMGTYQRGWVRLRALIVSISIAQGL
jgi:hypothetical protein